MVAKSDPIPTEPARWPGPSGRSRACNSHDTWGLAWGLGWAGPPRLKPGSPGAWRDPTSSTVRRPQPCLWPRAGATGRPGRQRPAAVTAAAARSSTPGLKQEPAPRGLQARGGSRGGQGRTRSSGRGPSRLCPGAPSPPSASAPSMAASLRVQVPSAHKDTSHWTGAALMASTQSHLQASIST